MLEHMILNEIRKLPQRESLLKSLLFFQENVFDEEREKKIIVIRKYLTIVNGWIDMLTQDEQFVVKLSIIEGLDWKRIAAEHGKKWGEHGRSVRSLQGCLKTAQEKICEQVIEQKDMIKEVGIFEVKFAE